MKKPDKPTSMRSRASHLPMSRSTSRKGKAKKFASAQSGKRKSSKCASRAGSERKRKGAILDGLTTELCKRRDNGICRKCGRPGDDPMHIFSRGNHSIRWTLSNVLWGCRFCHDYLDTHPAEKRLFAIAEIGEEQYELLSRARYWRELEINEMEDLLILYRSSI